MAHPCFECGGECYCNGDIDDVVVCKTPKNCEGCGCRELLGEDDDDFEEDIDDDSEFYSTGPDYDY
jgi:hypothetical protein